MVFSSITFLYYFLPIVLFFYFLVPWKWKNMILLLSSLLFYFYGEPRYCILLLFSSIFHYFIGKWIEHCHQKRGRLLLLLFSLFINFGILFYFKYYNFFVQSIDALFPQAFPYLNITLPIGISFFTFQTASYVIDIYRGKVTSSKNVFHFMTYVSMFPQLIAGPIVRYETIAEELNKRKWQVEEISLGIQRFVIGLAKKVMIADLLGEFSQTLNDIAPSFLGLWLRAIADTLQLYFDFSGYSDMAIGLGLLFGFHFLENFNYPLIAKSITDFWRRWHMSLSSWFRDYLYIPLGGNRVSKGRYVLNLFCVWFATGLWHGASWNFILWGLYFFLFLLLEKWFLLSFLNKHKWFGHFYTSILILISFVIFGRTDMADLVLTIKGMFGLDTIPILNQEVLFYLKEYLVLLFLSIFLATPLLKKGYQKLQKKKKWKTSLTILEPIFYIGLFLLCTAFIIDASFQPFLYFRF